MMQASSSTFGWPLPSIPAYATFGNPPREFSSDTTYFIADEVRIRRLVLPHNSAIKIPPAPRVL